MNLHERAGWRLAHMEALLHVRDAIDTEIKLHERNARLWAGDLCKNAIAAARGCEPDDVNAELLAFQIERMRDVRGELQAQIDDLFEGLPGMFGKVGRRMRARRNSMACKGLKSDISSST